MSQWEKIQILANLKFNKNYKYKIIVQHFN